MTTAKIIDLDAELGITTDDAPRVTKTVRLLGLDVRVVCDLNSFGLSNLTSGNSEDIMTFLRSMIHPDDWAQFSRTASMHPGLSGEDGAGMLVRIINKITEVAAERPTKQPSVLPRGGSSRVTARKSAAATASTRAGGSKNSR